MFSSFFFLFSSGKQDSPKMFFDLKYCSNRPPPPFPGPGYVDVGTINFAVAKFGNSIGQNFPASDPESDTD